MKASRFSGRQQAFILKQGAGGTLLAAGICRSAGLTMSEGTYAAEHGIQPDCWQAAVNQRQRSINVSSQITASSLPRSSVMRSATRGVSLPSM